MSLFGKILEKLGIGSAQAAPPPQAKPASAPQGAAQAQAAPSAAPATAPKPAAPTPIAVVDVVAKLEKAAAANPEKQPDSTPDTPRVLPNPCPHCGARMIVIEVFARGCEPRWRPTPNKVDTS